LKRLWLSIAVATVVLVAAPVLAQVATVSEEAARLIYLAGNTDDDSRRQAALEKLSSLPGDAALQRDARTLAAFVRRWNFDPALHFYSRDLQPRPSDGVPEFDFGVAENSPLRPIAELYRGRILAWYTLESGNQLRLEPGRYQRFKQEALISFRKVAETFPKNRVAGAYLGRPIPWPKSYPPVPGAPEWAELQREHLDRLRDVIHWWIDHRQQPDGSFGGGFGDDVEMWRWWSPLLLGFDDPKIIAGQRRLSEACLFRDSMKAGFVDRLRDVEHGAEETTDPLVPLLVLEPDDRRWAAAAQQPVELMQRTWTGRNQRGQIQFRSYRFSAAEVSPAAEDAFDVLANVQALNPALLLWLRTRDPGLGAPLTAWLDTWVEATARAENGKPAGIVPASLRWPDGQVSGAGGRWWEPVRSGASMHHYYLWPSILTELTDAMLVAHVVTGDEKYLAPLRSMAAIRLQYLKNPPTTAPSLGSEGWCAAQLAPRSSSHNNYAGLVKSLARCKAWTGTDEFDELLALEAPEHVVGFGKPNVAAVAAALRAGLEPLRVNFPLYTDEVRYTDRALRHVQFLATDNSMDEYRGVTLPKYELLYRLVTGDGNAARFAMPAVRWKTSPQDIAVWVRNTGRLTLDAELFHFGDRPRPLHAELMMLDRGRYRVELLDPEGRPLNGPKPRLEVNGPRPTLNLELPPQKLCLLRIRPE
jgi:hypothetical protein